MFNQFIKKQKNAFYIGAPEAEAESLPTSKVFLKDVYEDFHNIFEGLSNEKFILIGRKGCGKSAFAEYVYLKSLDEPNLFCSFIRQDSVNLETLVQLGSDANLDQTKEHLFKWLIYTNIIKMFFNNEAAISSSGYKLLQEFIKKNDGYIDINKGEIIELIKKHAFEINIEQFKRFFKGKFNKDIQIKESRAAFYKLLPHLEEVVVDVLTSDINLSNGNSYVIFFDDLDIDFDANSPESRDTLIQLLRISKYINNNVLAKSGASAKVIILIRDDIERLLCTTGADISKLFSSYSVTLDWYQEEYIKEDKEDNLALKKLINKRIKNAFRIAGMELKESDNPWNCMVSNEFNPKTSFKYIIDHTLFRPRDLILFFKPLETGRYEIPLDRYNINSLIGQYAAELSKEVSNELSSFYTKNQIQNIFDSLKIINAKYNCTYEQAIEIISNNCNELDSGKLLQDLFDRSIIGNVGKVNGFSYFKHKTSKKDAHEYSLDKNSFVILQSGIKIYVSHR